MPCIPWRTKALRGGQFSPFDVATRRKADLTRRTQALMRQADGDPHSLQRLLARAQGLQRILRAQQICSPAEIDPRKQARPNTGRVSKPELGRPTRRGTIRA
jgi:hypothetical protein